MLTGTKKKTLEPIDIHYHRFKGIKRAAKIIQSFEKDKVVLVYFDPDIDGLISGYFVCKFLTRLGLKFTWYINKNREHGFKIPIEKVHNVNIIAVDFQMSLEEIKALVNNGNRIVSMDHHVNEDDYAYYEGSNGKRGIIINNQYSLEEESGRYLSGAGVVFECLRLFDPNFDTQENRALVGITLLSDVRDIENRNARGYLTDLYTHKYKGYIGYLIDHTIGEKDYGFGVPRIDRNYVDYKLSPMINACLRFNKEDEVVEFILGSGKLSGVYLIKQRELVPRLLGLIHKRDFEGLYVAEIDSHDLSDEDYEVASNFIGLVASRLLDNTHSSICYMTDLDGSLKRASFRGHINGGNYLKNLNSTGLIEGVGHEPAFGIKSLRTDDLTLWKIARKSLEVDKEWKSCRSESDDIEYVSNLSFFTGAKGYNMGVENIFCLAQHRRYIKYTGSNIVKRRSGANYTDYAIDGISVMCFDNTLNPKEDLILPILERGVLNLYLQKKFESDFTDFMFDD